MPVFNFTVSNYTPFTKILSANINSDRNDIKTFLNTTKIDDTNIQNAGITPTTKLIGTGGTPGQVLATNGTSVIWSTSNLQAIYNVILGSAAQVTAGTATHSTFASVTQADGDRVLVLPGYVTTENWTITKKINVIGLGNTSVIAGTVTLSTGSSSTRLDSVQVQGNITINSGITGSYINCWLSSSFTFVDNNSTVSNLLFALQG